MATNGDEVTFIVKQSCILSGRTRYALYVASLHRMVGAKRLLEASFLADLSQHPGTDLWTIRGDFGAGVQLYDIDRRGRKYPLVVSKDLVDWGGEISFFDAPHKEGVMSYGWAPNGSGLWYARPIMRPAVERHDGLVFDPSSMQARDILNDSGDVKGIELRYFSPTLSIDRQLAAVPKGGPSSWTHVFARAFDVVKWQEDSRSLRYQRSDFDVKRNGRWDKAWSAVDVETGTTQRLKPTENEAGVATGFGTFYSINAKSGNNHLVETDVEGRLTKDHGTVGFDRVLRVLARYTQKGQVDSNVVLAVSYRTHDGVAVASAGERTKELSTDDNLRQCAFSGKNGLGACVRESVTRPPEIVIISCEGESIRRLAPLNAQYDRIPHIIYEHAQWTNRYGHVNDGYITYPRHYVPGNRYPAVLITHGPDARNRFPPSALWDFPVEVFAENGYVVLLVNESPTAFERFGALFEKGGQPSTSEAQQAFALDAVASMEAAVTDVSRRGIINQDMVGIAGWSRGGEVVEYAMSQSKLFKAGILADGYIGADIYWMGGINIWPRVARTVYGGSPFDSDPNVLRNYQQLAPAFRAANFSGPVLFVSPSSSAVLDNMEPFRFLSDARVPVEVTYFPHEGHIFWDPRHRAAVMQRALEWFDYWLQGKMESGQGTEDIYSRWNTLAEVWREKSLVRAMPSTP